MKLKILNILVFLMVLWGFGFFSVAYAEQGKGGQSTKEHYVIGVEDVEYAPLWSYDEERGEYTGLARRILDAFAYDAGYTFEYKALPIRRLFRTFLADEVDFKFPDSPYWALDLKSDHKVIYSFSVIPYIDGVFVMQENLGKGKQNFHTLGIVLGFTPWSWQEEITAGEVEVKEVPNFDSLILLATSDRVSGIYANTMVLQNIQKSAEKGEGLVFDTGLPHIRGDYLLSTKRHPKIIAELNEWLSVNQEKIRAYKIEAGIKDDGEKAGRSDVEQEGQ